MNKFASLNMVRVTDAGARQAPLSESTGMGNVTLHVQVSRMQRNDVSAAISFQST